MDFIDWCGFILTKLIEACNTSPETRSIGVDQHYLARFIFGQEVTNRTEFQTSTQQLGMFDALRELEKVNLIESSSLWKATRQGRELIQDQDTTPLWQTICQERLGPEEEQLLKVVNKLSSRSASDHSWLKAVSHTDVMAELEEIRDVDNLWPLSQELEQIGVIECSRYFGPRIEFRATYNGLVWETRRGYTMMSRFIDELVSEWETTSVEFKQYLYIKSVEQKAEFIKDILGLANTKTSGRRWMIIGYSNKTHDYSNPPNTDLNQDDLERLIGEYTHPYLDVVYEVVKHRKGLVGKLEILRDPQKLPYRVAKSLGDKLKGDKKQIFKGQIFVRHGTQVVVARGTERKELLEEGKRARSNPQI